jgi:addiction module HigA family antidote
VDDFLSRLPGVTQAEVADGLGVSRPRLNELVNGVRGVTPDTAMRLAKGFGTTPEFWMSAQATWDLYEAARSRQRMREIERIEAWAEFAAPAAPEEEVGDDPTISDLTTEIGVLASGYAAAAEAPGASFYEEFLERKGLLAEAKRFVRIRAQLEALQQPEDPAEKERKVRGLVLSAPAPTFTE